MKNKNLSKLFTIAGSALLLVGGLTACGPTGGPSESEGPSGKVTVEFWHTFGQTIVDQLTAKIEKFQEVILKNEGVEVTVNLTYQGSYDDIQRKISNGFAIGNIPTLAVAYPDHVADYLYTEGNNHGKYVVNFEDYFDHEEYGYGKNSYLKDSQDENDIIPAFLNEGRQFVREGTYCFPYMKSSEVMFYNVEQINQLLPLYNASLNSESAIQEFLNNMSWETFLDVCDVAVKNKDKLISTLNVPAFYDSDSNFFISKMFQNNIAYSSINQTTQKGQIDFETGEANTKAKEMVSSFKAAYDAGLITTKGCEGKYGSNAFIAQESLFSIGSSGGSGYNFPDSGNFTVGVCKVPASNNNPLYVSQGPSLCMLNNPSISSKINSENLEYAWKLIKWITNTDNNIELCIRGSEGYVPIRTSSYETEVYFDFLENGENYAKVATIVADEIDGHYLSTAVFKGSATLRDQVGGIISSVLLGQSTVDEAFLAAINNTKLQIV